MEAQPLLLTRPPGLQVVLAVVVPAAFGLICGLLLGVSEVAYLVLSLLAILGGIAGGYEHPNAREGALRGVCGGLLFGVFILVGHAVFGLEAKAHLPEPQGLLPVITTAIGVPLHALGGKLRERHERRHRVEPLISRAGG